MSFGVLSTGFAKKTLADILSEIETQQKADIDPNLNTLATSVIGQFNGIFADKVREIWDVLEGVYNGAYPDSASGAQLDGVAAITGATRIGAKQSTVSLFVTGDVGTSLVSGRRAKVPGGGSFITQVNGTIAAANAWAPTTAYATDDIVTNTDGSTDRIYVATAGGTSAGAGGPTTTGTNIVDGTVTWRFLGEGLGFAQISSLSVAFTAVVGQAFTITEIETPVSGWLGVSNLEDAVLGRDIETDEAFRARREQLIRVSGAATLEALRAAIINTTGVNQALVFENTTLITDVNGVPGKAFEAVVSGGTDLDVATTIFLTKPLGIQSFGNDVFETVVDSQGISHSIDFSRPTDLEIFVDVTVTVDGNYPIDGDTQVAQAIKDLGDTLDIGEDVIFKKFECEPFKVSGVIDITAFVMDKRPSVVTSANAETFALSDGQTLTVKVDGGAEQTATFNTGDFGDIANATAAEVAAVITTDIVGATGGAPGGGLVDITSDAAVSIEVTGGTANGALGFPTTFTPTGTANIVVASRELARFDTGRITVTSV